MDDFFELDRLMRSLVTAELLGDLDLQLELVADIRRCVALNGGVEDALSTFSTVVLNLLALMCDSDDPSDLLEFWSEYQEAVELEIS